MNEDYTTKDFNESVWLTISGIPSTGTTTDGDEVHLHFPDKEECLRLVRSTDFIRYTNTIREVKSIIRNALN